MVAYSIIKFSRCIWNLFTSHQSSFFFLLYLRIIKKWEEVWVISESNLAMESQSKQLTVNATRGIVWRTQKVLFNNNGASISSPNWMKLKRYQISLLLFYSNRQLHISIMEPWFRHVQCSNYKLHKRLQISSKSLFSFVYGQKGCTIQVDRRLNKFLSMVPIHVSTPKQQLLYFIFKSRFFLCSGPWDI